VTTPPATPPPVPPITLAVLDMAGTTVVDGGLVEAAFLAALQSVGIPADDPGNPERLQYVVDTMGQSKIVVFRHLLGDEDTAQAALAGFEAAIQSEIAAGRVGELTGAADALAALRAAGVRVCLTTGFTSQTQHLIVDKLGWSSLIDLALAPGPGVRGRPYPDLVLAAVMALEVDDVRSVAVVGDTANDLLCGHRAGAGIVAGVLTGAHDATQLAAAPHTHVLASVADLPAVVSAHNAAHPHPHNNL
jgi:phosphoglycolate phosphatase